MSHYLFQTREVQDLAWACFAPPLLLSEALADDAQNIACCDLPLTPARQAWLQQLDQNPAPLHDHLNSKPSPRLGIYFERLWHFFLQQDPRVNLLAHNLPVHDGQRTIGEFDCLYYCADRQRHFHLELAVKYFLGHRQDTRNEQASHWREWLGPASQDRLDLKINHLMLRQIQLGDHPAAQQQLNDLGISSVTKEVEIKGYLFQSWQDPLPPPHGFNPVRELDRWLSRAQLSAFLEGHSCPLFLPLAKPDWLGPALDSNKQAQDTVAFTQRLDEIFGYDQRPQLVAALDSEGREQSRFFVTQNGWPKTA